MSGTSFAAAARRLAAAVKRRRRSLGLTQEDVAYEAGLSVRHYQQLESGVANPTYRTLFDVARVLGQTVRDLIEAAERHR